MGGEWQFVQPVLSLIVATVVAWLAGIAMDWAVRRRHSHTQAPVWMSLHRRCRLPLRMTLTVAVLLIALPYVGLSHPLTQLLRQIFVVALIATVTWLAIQVTKVVEDVAQLRFDIDVSDNRRARRFRTQILVFRRVTITVLVFGATAAAIMTIPWTRTLGASFLVSAGVLSVVVGIAAQTTVANLLAGLQIALTDPLRIDDVVVVNDEWGRVEEVTLTYVVVRTWDNRRLILPISWFTTNVFQNWTWHEATVLGSIVWHVDFTLPVEEIRAEFYRIVERSPLWDGRDRVLQVVDSTASTMVLRGLVSAADAPSNWDLCCDVRERMLMFLQAGYPSKLPKLRADVSNMEQRRNQAADTGNSGIDASHRNRSAAE